MVASILFAPPICLTTGSPEAPTHCTSSKMLFSLSDSQLCPQVWDSQNLFVAGHHFSINIQLENPIKYITQV